ncbi:perlucin-like, partial [Saccostrea cucullata]|uniref:perlucin-like n=1 Tax=Saccostrea cuccullata TaxID=36930 RepID=UPI002ED64F37
MSKNQHTILIFLTGIYSISGVFCSWVTCSENGVAYMFEEQKVDWNEAARGCEFAGGSLAIIRSNFDEDCIVRNLKQSVGPYSIGGTKSSSGLWTWMDGTLITQPTYWATGEPNNAGDGENCLHFRLYDGVYFWNDISCNVIGGYVCQRTPYSTESMTSVTNEQSTTSAMETTVTTH